MLVSVKELEDYTKIKLEKDTSLQIYIDSAKDIIVNYLGYDPEIKLITEINKGLGTNKIFLKNKPIYSIYRINDYETGEEIFSPKRGVSQEYYIEEEKIIFDNLIIPKDKKIIVKYVYGYGFLDFSINSFYGGEANTLDWATFLNCGTAYDEFSDIISGGNSNNLTIVDIDVPPILKQTILRIATLLLTEADNNIGITSKQFGDSGGRTFINYTNFDKYLNPLSRYRLMVI
jgi:hypothetical protein